MRYRFPASILSLLILGSAAIAAEAPAESKESLDTAATESEEAGKGLPVVAPAVDTVAPAAVAKPDTTKPVLAPEPVAVVAPRLASLKVGGTFQLKAFYKNITADRDEDKRLSLDVRRARVDISGELPGRFSIEGQFRMDGDGQRFGTDAAYLAYTHNAFFKVSGGKLKRPFSQEALQSSKSLYTVERGGVYQNFLDSATGYSDIDLGLVVQGGFIDEDVPVTYEAGIFNGRQAGDADKGYKEQQDESVDKGFKAKDFVFRLVAQPFAPLKVEAAVSTKAAEARGDGENFEYHVNTAYQMGADFAYGPLRLLGEMAWGDNHRGVDQGIISGGARFFGFYATGLWREEYRGGRASELVLKLEGLDPDFEFGSGKGTPNDGLLRYTGGVNWFFTPRVSVLLNYSVLQPLTKVSGKDDLVHDIDAMWRISF